MESAAAAELGEALLRIAELLRFGPETAFAYIAVFTRMSGLVFFVPGLSERVIPIQVRLGGALALSALVLPGIAPSITVAEISVSQGLAIIAAEAIAGLFLGLGMRVVIFALQMAGSVISQSLSVAQGFVSGMTIDLDTSVGTVLALAGAAILLATGVHAYVVALITTSYGAIPFGAFAPAEGVVETLIERTGWAVHFGLALALPFIIVSFVYNLALGTLNRAMPQLMVAFVGAPAIMAIGMVGLAIAAPLMLEHWSVETGEIYASLLAAVR